MKRLVLILAILLLAIPALAGPAAIQTATVKVGPDGYTPSVLTLQAGVPAEVTFLRTEPGGCVDRVLLPELGVARDLPLNQPVKVAFTPHKGTLTFTCGMKMVKGTIHVR